MKLNSFMILGISLFISVGAQAKDKYVFATHLQKPASDTVRKRMTEACALVGLKCEVQEMPGKRGLGAANSGEVDGDTTRVANIKELSPEDTGNLSQVKESIFDDDFVLITKSSTNIPEVSWAEVNKLKSISFIRGSKLIEKNIDAAKQSANTDLDSIFAMLTSGRVEGVVFFRIPAAEYLKSKGLTDLKIHDKALGKNSFFPWVNNANKDIIPKLEEGLKKLKASGKF